MAATPGTHAGAGPTPCVAQSQSGWSGHYVQCTGPSSMHCMLPVG